MRLIRRICAFISRRGRLPQNQTEQAKKICDFVNRHGQLPRATQTDEQQQRLQEWLQAHPTPKFYQSDQEIAEERGYPDMFDPK